MAGERVYLYDSTLRDGAQTYGVDFSVADKQAIAQALDRLGIDYAEGGWPGANPTDDAFFTRAPRLHRTRLSAFGMTRRPGRSASNDPGLAGLIDSGARVICLVGKSWDFQVDIALGIERSENIAMIGDSIAHLVARDREAIFDAEHFFDGYRANPAYAMACLQAAYRAGARWIVLCDTNGGSLPRDIERIVAAVTLEIPGDRLGIHCHNDSETAVANSLAAVQAGVRQVQGTLNGLGERCGNANLISVLPALMLKMGYDTGVTSEGLAQLTSISHMVDERLNRAPWRHACYVGESAFAHKGGLHVSAVEKDPSTYEHVPPEAVGNRRKILVSDQAGRSNIVNRCRDAGIDLSEGDEAVVRLVELVKNREYEGYAYDGADASFELLARRSLGKMPVYFTVNSFRVIDERRWNAVGHLVTLSEASIRVTVDGNQQMTVADGNGPVDALDAALRKALTSIYPILGGLRLVDYKVRILTPQDATKAVTRVMIESQDESGERWSTVGVSPNIIDASFNALSDAISYKLFRAASLERAA